MRNISTWSLGVCTLCAALAPAQGSPDHRGFLPEEKQSVNKFAPRAGLPSFNEKREGRSFFAESTLHPISKDKADKYTQGALNFHNLARELSDSPQTRNLSFLHLVPGEKGNAAPERAETHSLMTPSKHRFLQEESYKPRDFSAPAERR